MRLKGVVLAGGKSSRFGEDKALAQWEGTTLLERAVGLLSAMDLNPEVIASPEKKYSFLTCRTHNDIISEKGPLGGLYTAFSLFPESALLVLTCDMPFVTQDVLRVLVQAHQQSDGPAVFEVDGAPQPFPGIYLSAFKAQAQECLLSNRPSVKHFLSLIQQLKVLPPPADTNSFANVNSREDLKRPEL